MNTENEVNIVTEEITDGILDIKARFNDPEQLIIELIEHLYDQRIDRKKLMQLIKNG